MYQTIHYIVIENTYCVAPSSLKDQRIFDMGNINLCHNGSTFFHWVALLLIGAGFLLGYRWFRRHGRSIRIPFTVGYSPLKSDEGPQPAFV
uniref:Uncharacterized protein n=1 Tax=Acrobeloides nanus TaxID=290746 RepID=A0A914DXF0_9BILA